MSHIDEGLIHAWIENQLPEEEAARVAKLVATDAAWGAAAAEARGLIAGSSRILGALDSVAAADAPIAIAGRRGEPVGPGKPAESGASWARSPWLRVAAAVVLVVGVSGVFLSGGGDDVTIANDAIAVQEYKAKRDSAGAGPPVVAEPVTAAANAAAPSQRNESAREIAAPGARSRAGVAPAAAPPAATPPAVPTPPPTATAVRDEAARVATTGVIDSSADQRASGGRGGGRGRGGGGGRAAGSTGAATEQGALAQGSLAAQKSAEGRSDARSPGAIRVDSVLNSCWVELDGSMRRQAAESERGIVTVFRFVPPVLTDIVGGAASSVRAVPPPAANMAAPLRAPLPTSRVQNITPHAKDDSTLVGEWVSSDGQRTQLTFRVRADTLRGTTSTIIGERANSGPAFVAVRALCPQ